MEIVIEILEDDFTVRNNIISTIYLFSRDISFPEEDWTDFIIIVLHWWNQEFLQQISTGSETGKYDFMDGPFYFILKVAENNSMKFFGMEESTKGVDTVLEVDLKTEEFLNALKEASNKILLACHQMKYDSPDVQNLKNSFKKLQLLDEGTLNK